MLRRNRQESFVGKNFAVLEEIAEFSGRTSGIIGFVDRSLEEQTTDNVDRKITNAAAIVQNGDVKGIYHKCYLPNYSVFDEARYFAKGTKPEEIFWYEDVGVGINVCEDIWIDEGPAEEQVKRGASLIININASPFDIDKTKSRKEKVIHKAKKLNVPIIYLNMVGGQDELVFDGGSFVVESYDDRIDPVGACVGMNGTRIHGIVRELKSIETNLRNAQNDLANVREAKGRTEATKE